MAKKSNSRETKQKKASSGTGALPAFCNVLGTLMLVVVIGLCAPLTVPLLMGYSVFDVVSGSMEPEIPTGSVVYVKSMDPLDIQEGEIIAYQDGESVIVHRVVTNRTSLGEFVTKGDANAVEDFEPIPYEAVVGRMEAHVPMLGAFMAVYASVGGKVYLLLIAACGVMLNMVASRMRDSRRERELQEELAASVAGARSAGLGEDGPATGPGNELSAGGAEGSRYADHSRESGKYARKATPRRRGGILRVVLVAVLAVAFLGSAGVIGYVNWQYSVSDALYGDAADKYMEETEGDSTNATKAPIKIDFEKLCADNPDVIGWIYCPGTVINYPVLQGKDNDQYLHHDYTGSYNINGSIFVDAGNARGFADSNTIIYGHHMNSGSMFASLEKWGDQDYYHEHPIMWLLTPTQDYKIVLFSAHHVNAYSTMYQIIHTAGEELGALLGEALVESSLHANAQLDSTLHRLALSKGVDFSEVQVNEDDTFVLLDSESCYVMLSTCAYLFDNDRFVLHGKLVPVSSVGGKATK